MRFALGLDEGWVHDIEVGLHEPESSQKSSNRPE